MVEKISIFEVGPRDGLQNIKNEIPINRKIELINILSTTGIEKIFDIKAADNINVGGLV